MEKVKQKGLQEFADQMNECLKDQKETEMLFILQRYFSLINLSKNFKLLSKSMRKDSTRLRSSNKVLYKTSRFEAETRKLANQEEEQTRKVKVKRDELLSFQSSSMNK
jgi:hypothetical protein